jgi:hypothetical protein
VLVGGRREWLTIHDIDTGAGALDYGTLTAGRDYVEHFVARTLASGGGRSGPLGAGTGHVIDARRLVSETVAAIEAAFASSPT